MPVDNSDYLDPDGFTGIGNDDDDDFRIGRRCKCLRLTGTIITDVWSGYVTVRWDNGTVESGVHIADIELIKEETHG